MKKFLSLVLIFLFLSSCTRERFPFFKPLPPASKSFTDGLTLLTLEDRELPTAQLHLLIRGGSVYDPPGKEGLSSVAMQAIRMGGTVNRPPHEIDDLLEFSGATLEMGSNSEYFWVEVSSLKPDLNRVLDLLFDLLRQPALKSERFESVRARAKEALVRDMEDPLKLAYREFPAAVVGRKSPWGRTPTLSSLDRITLQDVREFHRKFFAPDRILIAAAGDFSAEEIFEKIGSRIQEWPASRQPLPEIPPLEETYEKGLVVIPKKNLTQTTILMGHLGSKRDNPDKFPLIVLNFILGGSGALTSRLGEEIRTEAGKAYSVWSDFGFGKDFGLFRMVAQTKSSNTDWVIQKMKEILTRLTRDPQFSRKELDRAKKALLWSLFFDFESRFQQVKQQTIFRLWGYPENYLETFQQKIAQVTEKDLERVAKKYLHPDGLKTLLILDEKEAKRIP